MSHKGFRDQAHLLRVTPAPSSPLPCQGHLASSSQALFTGRIPYCQVWWAELQMGPKGVAEPHCLNQCPAHLPPLPRPGSGGCWPAPQQKPHRADTGPSCLPSLSQLLVGINNAGQGR